MSHRIRRILPSDGETTVLRFLHWAALLLISFLFQRYQWLGEVMQPRQAVFDLSEAMDGLGYTRTCLVPWELG
jgi:hypothetical protein